MIRDPLESWPKFAARVRERLEAGRAAYGDRSFERPPGELLAELEQEALDMAGWGFVLWVRLERLRARLGEATLCASGCTTVAGDHPEPRRMCGYERGRELATQPRAVGPDGQPQPLRFL